MKKSDINDRYHEICSSLSEMRLIDAFKQLENLLILYPEWELNSQLDQLRTSYRYMLQYLLMGTEDPGRQKLHHKIITDTWKIADRLSHHLLVSHTKSTYTETYLRCQQETSLAEILAQLETFQDNLDVLQMTDTRVSSLEQEMAEHEKLEEQLFDKIWTSIEWTAEERQTATIALNSETLLNADLCLLISAVTMSLLQYFDERKILFILDAIEHTESHVQIRAIVCLMLLLYLYDTRIPFYPEIMSRLHIKEDDKDFCQGMNMVYLQLLKAQDTQKITKKMREEIMPEVIKNMKKFGHGLDPYEENDKNPDWENIDQILDEKMREMNDILMEGGDVYMSTFSMMKQFPFFRIISHWFLPYFQQHSLVLKAIGNNSQTNDTINIILSSSGICDNDKYSMLCVLPSMPEQQKQMIANKISNSGDPVMIQENLQEMEKYNQRKDVIANNYTHCLYRFFKLFPKLEDCPDIFDESLDFYESQLFRNFVGSAQYLREICNYLFKYERYRSVLNVLNLIESRGETIASDYQKMGYCYQHFCNYSSALSYYEKADMLQPHNSWTIRHIATCYRLTHCFQESLSFYQQAATLLPENKSIIYQTGVCLLELARYDEALQKFFQLELMESNSPKIWRAIGWCSFMQGKYEQSINYFKKAINQKPLPNDTMNLGHVYLVQGQFKKAIEFYKEASKQMRSDVKDYGSFNDVFCEDEKLLEEKGIDSQLFPLILDLVSSED